MTARTETQAKPPADPLTEFGTELDALIRRWSEKTGGRCETAARPTLIEELPVDGFRRQRRGPLIEITLTVTDMTRAHELFWAFFPVPQASRLLREREQSLKSDG